ncbi:SigE family RNA polymerase sigma factor [Actinocorallia sp. API 0066]|uniref:SigE family RNA polymerase sigma factor n=1 Tax=Actinocorallia sp. API 0066 TaxID=2896846 RepID=UPI001E57740D|nr:SigE family RNA polymerase sigma factor [Actinocorallia sp. API 0066]MCD0450050.1 SigE family RNA polymerase sigma factor [Actinocorallia sp. API 0066]
MADEESFRRFVAERSPSLLRLAYLLTADRSAAEDLVQNALVKAYLRWKRIETNPEAYVRRILVTVAADEHRRPHRRHETPAETLPERPGADPFAAVDGNVRLRAALAALPAGQRAAVVLRHWVGLEVAEVADLLGCSAVTVRSQTMRGLDKLREAYGVRDDAHG